MADELLDIYDDDFKHIGTMSRKEVHRLGYWHYTFHLFGAPSVFYLYLPMCIRILQKHNWT